VKTVLRNFRKVISGDLFWIAAMLIVFVAVLSMEGSAQEVMVTDFPPGVGIDIDSGFFEPYSSQLRNIAEILKDDTLAVAVITGSADGIKYLANHDAKNPGLAVGRALALRNYVVKSFGVDENRIFIQSENIENTGGQNRFAKIVVEKGISYLNGRIDKLERQSKLETQKADTANTERVFEESLGLRLGAGYTSTPFGGMPIVTGSITWKRTLFIEAVVGHTIWNSSYTFDNTDLSTRRQGAGVLVSLFPEPKIPVGLVAGWMRIEEVSRKYNAYVRMSEGPIIGIRVSPLDFLSLTVLQNTAKQNIIGDINSRLKNGQFIFFADIHITLGGGK